MVLHRRPRWSLWLFLLVAVVAAGCLPFGPLADTAGRVVNDVERTDRVPSSQPPEPGGGGNAPTVDGVDGRPVDGDADADKPPKARLAIVIDDMGPGQPGSDELLAYPLPLSFAVLPGTAHAEDVVARATADGRAVLLHLPMEPVNVADNNPGPEAIYVAMTDEDIQRQTAKLLDMLPGVTGVNNHMGSAATADARVMATVLGEVQQRGLFFLDSRTTAASVAAQEAERIGLPYAVNDLFLDLERTVPAVKAMVAEAIRRAEVNGTFIAIAHPHPSVAAALYEMIPEFAAAGVALVPVTDLLQHPAD